MCEHKKFYKIKLSKTQQYTNFPFKVHHMMIRDYFVETYLTTHNELKYQIFSGWEIHMDKNILPTRDTELNRTGPIRALCLSLCDLFERSLSQLIVYGMSRNSRLRSQRRNPLKARAKKVAKNNVLSRFSKNIDFKTNSDNLVHPSYTISLVNWTPYISYV